MDNTFDIVIVGGGLVARSLLLALDHLALRIAVVESVTASPRSGSALDLRCFALTPATKNFFTRLQQWPSRDLVTPIKHLHVSQRQGRAMARFSAEDVSVEALGYCVEAHALLSQLTKATQSVATWFCPASFQDLKKLNEGYQLRVQTETGLQTIQARLLVAADGQHSTVRQALAIPVEKKDYHQSAVVCTVQLKRGHGYCAYERFTASGPIAVLPLSGQRVAVIWTLPTAQIEACLAQSESSFLASLQAAFGYRCGRFLQCGPRRHYPLQSIVAKSVIKPDCVLLGNAAQSINPVAAQGYNLALRDVAMLAELFEHGDRAVQDNESMLQSFEAWRAPNHQRIVQFTDGLAEGFLPQVFGIPLLRDVGLHVLDVWGPLKKRFLRLMMGYGEKTPRLMCDETD